MTTDNNQPNFESVLQMDDLSSTQIMLCIIDVKYQKADLRVVVDGSMNLTLEKHEALCNLLKSTKYFLMVL